MSETPTEKPFVFPSWVNYLLPLVLIGVLGGALYVPSVVLFGAAPTSLAVGYQPEQPVPYSHALHVGQLGLDCLYCHTSVDKAAFAALPPTQTCINCHNPDDKVAGIRKKSPLLKPVFDSWKTGEPIKWVKIHDLADYAYFNHSAHVNKGVSCVSCHGRIDQMEVVYQAKPLSMAWCLDCHRAPENFIRPKDKVTNLAWDPKEIGTTQEKLGLELKEKYGIHDTAYMTSCSTCHR